MAYILDTNIAIHLRDQTNEVLTKVAALESDVMVSILTRIELENGVYRDPSQTAVRRARVDAILQAIPTLTFDEDAAEAYRGIVEAVGFSRRKILDRMIAAQALTHRAILITMNPADFTDVPGLQIEVW